MQTGKQKRARAAAIVDEIERKVDIETYFYIFDEISRRLADFVTNTEGLVMKNRNEEKHHNEIIGKRLKEFRNSKHLSQQELADKLGYESFQSISNIENGRSRIKKDKAILLSQIFGGNENYWLDVNVIYLYEKERSDIMPTEEEIRLEKIECRLDRIEKYITSVSGGIRIGIQEQHGWGISNQQFDEIRSILTEIILEQEVKQSGF